MVNAEVWTADHSCPWCGRTNQALAGPDGAEPDEDSILICWKCREPSMLVLTAFGIATRKPTAEEIVEIEPQVRQARAAMRESHLPTEAGALLERDDEA